MGAGVGVGAGVDVGVGLGVAFGAWVGVGVGVGGAVGVGVGVGVGLPLPGVSRTTGTFVDSRESKTIEPLPAPTRRSARTELSTLRPANALLTSTERQPVDMPLVTDATCVPPVGRLAQVSVLSDQL